VRAAPDARAEPAEHRALAFREHEVVPPAPRLDLLCEAAERGTGRGPGRGVHVARVGRPSRERGAPRGVVEHRGGLLLVERELRRELLEHRRRDRDIARRGGLRPTAAPRSDVEPRKIEPEASVGPRIRERVARAEDQRQPRVGELRDDPGHEVERELVGARKVHRRVGESRLAPDCAHERRWIEPDGADVDRDRRPSEPGSERRSNPAPARIRASMQDDRDAARERRRRRVEVGKRGLFGVLERSDAAGQGRIDAILAEQVREDALLRRERAARQGRAAAVGPVVHEAHEPVADERPLDEDLPPAQPLGSRAAEEVERELERRALPRHVVLHVPEQPLPAQVELGADGQEERILLELPEVCEPSESRQRQPVAQLGPAAVPGRGERGQPPELGGGRRLRPLEGLERHAVDVLVGDVEAAEVALRDEPGVAQHDRAPPQQELDPVELGEEMISRLREWERLV